MLDPVSDFCPFGVIEAVECSDQIPGDTANSFKRKVCFLRSSALRAARVDDAVIAAYRIAVHRMID